MAVQKLRTLTRTRKQFVRERASHVQRIEKLLEDANIKMTVSVRRIHIEWRALPRHSRVTDVMNGKCRWKRQTIESRRSAAAAI